MSKYTDSPLAGGDTPGEGSASRFPRYNRIMEGVGTAVYDARVSILHFISGRAFNEPFQEQLPRDPQTLRQVGATVVVFTGLFAAATVNIVMHSDGNQVPAIDQNHTGQPFKYESSPAPLGAPVRVETPAV